MVMGVRPLVRGAQAQGKCHDFGSEGHTHDTEELTREGQQECSATRPHGVRGLACTEPYANGVQVTAVAERELLASRHWPATGRRSRPVRGSGGAKSYSPHWQSRRPECSTQQH
jgi:hypothetical protein